MDRKRKEDRIALIISIILVIIFLIIAYILAGNHIIKKYEKEHRFDNIEENYVLFPDGMKHSKENLDEYVYNVLESEYVNKDYKEELIEYLIEQNIDTFKYEYYLENEKRYVEETIEDNDEQYKDFLVENGLINDTENIEKVSDNIGELNGKPVKSYKNLLEAEEAFGLDLGLYQKCNSLNNFEMIAAYVVNEEFMQCVYARNEDGSALNDEQNIYESDLTTVTIKLTNKFKSDELINNYNEFNELYNIELDDTIIYFKGNSKDDVKLAYCDRPDNRSYSIYCAEGMLEEDISNLVYELFNNLYYNEEQ